MKYLFWLNCPRFKTGMSKPVKPPDFKHRLEGIIFRTDTPEGRAFDIVLLVLIVISVILVMIESVKSINAKYGGYLLAAEYIVTALFTVEYIARLWTAERKIGYITSFYGIIDLVSLIPTYLLALSPVGHSLAIIRGLRLLRIFRIFKLGRYTAASRVLSGALKASKEKIAVFIVTVLSLVSIIGTLMYLIEGDDGQFTSIPKAIYWAIVTVTTVGYGDIAPVTPIGQMLASILMLLGYGVVAVPTGIVTSEIVKSDVQKEEEYRHCDMCEKSDLPANAKYCLRCGNNLDH